MQNHLIQKQTVEVILHGTEAQALELQRQVAALCENGLLVEIEKVLNLYDNENITIDYLRVDVNGLNTGNLEAQLIASVAAQLKAVLQSKAPPKRSMAPAPAHDGNLIVYKRDAQGLRESRVELVFFHFLRTGVLQWWTSPDQAKSWEAAILNLLSASPPTLQQLQNLLYQSPAARQRFLLQFSHNWQQQVLPLLDVAMYAHTLVVRRILLALSPGAFSAKETGFFQWQLNSIVQLNETLPALLSNALSCLGYAGLPEMRTLTLPQIEKRLHAISTDAPENAAEHDVRKPGLAKLVYEVLQQPAPPVSETTANVSDVVMNGEEDVYYIHNAGLILLVPFLPQFLRQCEAADENGVIREGYAAALLEYLASGRTGVGEHEMIFNKLLCGIPLGQPIAKITTLNAAHIEEADKLLHTVIDNWPVLKNTSTDGLRASFLQRPGKLSVKASDDNWLLQVECRSYDEWLLGELPWGYQVAGLPFSKPKKLIWTEWL